MSREMLFCSLFKRSQFASSRQRRRDSKLPLMDLSSLEGPPLADPDPRVIVPGPVDNIFPRIQQEPPTPESPSHYYSYHTLYTKPLPPRPASADPLDLRQLRHPISNNRMASSHTDPSLSDSNLRRMPAQRGRRSYSNELRPGDGIAAADPVRDVRSRSPSVNPYLYTECRVPRRPRSAPLVWSEEEELWVVTGGSASSERPPTRHSRPPRLETHLSEPSLRSEDPVDEDLDHDALLPPPSYDSHGFSHTHVVRQQRGGPESRWGAVARRLHDLSNG
ncbi:hypothetical protein PoHVEF18_006367 [Penicillium ochrochloron]